MKSAGIVMMAGVWILATVSTVELVPSQTLRVVPPVPSVKMDPLPSKREKGGKHILYIEQSSIVINNLTLPV